MTPDEAMIAQLQEANRKATKGEWRIADKPDGDAESMNDVADVRGVYIIGPYAPISCKAEADAIVLSHNALPRLIELAREALASRAVCEAAKNYWHNSEAQGVLGDNDERALVSAINNYESTLASATRKESA